MHKLKYEMHLSDISVSKNAFFHKMKLGFPHHCCSSHPLAAALAFVFALLNILLFSQISYGQSVDSLPVGSIIHANQTLISQNGTFALGFFSLGSDLNYVGISYNKLSNSTHIWMANRNTPAKDGASLVFSNDGNLFISNPDQTTVWTSGTGGLNITSMTMAETGNFVLMNVSGMAVWESFDHPADTWVPGMKMYLGTNLTSSISAVNVAEGNFSMLMLPSTQFISVWNITTQYWSSGVWNGNGFAGVPEMTQNYFYDFQFVNDTERPYFTWSEKQSNIHSHFALEYDGVIRVHTWDSINAKWYTIWSQPKDPCQVEHLCGEYGICNNDATPFCSCPQGLEPVDPAGWSNGDWSQGCATNVTASCSSVNFGSLDNTSYDQAGSGGENSYSGQDQEGCQAHCVSDCACLGFSFDGATGSCTLQHGPFFNGRTSREITETFFLREHFPSTQAAPGSHTHSRVIWAAGLAAAGCAALLLIALLIWLITRKKQVTSDQSHPSSDYISGILRKYSYKELQSATNNFSDKLGAGGFGSVFKGRLRDKTMVAVKKLHSMKQGDKDFRAEVSTLGMIQHINLVRLHGFCAEGDHRLLVYDYMSNGSLNSHLFPKDEGHQKGFLDWDTRFAIAKGTARGITYLHEKCRSCIIHCDIKPENILLDAQFSAKVSDFGLAKLMGREFSRVITSFRGTRGYLAPEWLSSIPITAKADVYSYGMTLFEIISGRRNIDPDKSVEQWYFPSWACKRALMEDFESVADSRLQGKVKADEVKRAVLVALWCIQDEESSRPSMSKVVQMLEGTAEIADPPYPKSLQMLEVERDAFSQGISISMPLDGSSLISTFG